MYCYAAEGDEKGNGKRGGGQRRIFFWGGERVLLLLLPIVLPAFWAAADVVFSFELQGKKSLFGHRSTILTNYFLLGGQCNLEGRGWGIFIISLFDLSVWDLRFGSQEFPFQLFMHA